MRWWAAGVELRRLLWLRVYAERGKREADQPWSRLEQALKATDLLLQTGGFGAIVLDMSDVLPQHARRIHWQRGGGSANVEMRPRKSSGVLDTPCDSHMSYPDDSCTTNRGSTNVSKQDELLSWMEKSQTLLIKKLSRNDCLWAKGREFGHQSGPYIPKEVKDSGFFPALVNTNLSKPHIYDASLLTLWPETGEIRTSALKHYSNKGTEMHFTGVPKELFVDLAPASFLVGGRLRTSVADVSYWFMTIDSTSDLSELLESMFDLDSDFHHGIFSPDSALAVPLDETEILIKDLTASLDGGTLQAFINSVSQLPTSESLAAAAQSFYLQEYRIASLNPFAMANPGDAIMRISRDIEYKLYKRAELRHRAAEVVRIVTEGGMGLVEAIVRGFPQLDATFLSASQHRKSRAGRSFERHIARFLHDGGINFEEQAVTGGRRPDFVMPSLIVLNDKVRTFDGALVLSAKTTLRERWKQLAMEKFNCALFLATVDDRVSTDAIDDMHVQEICLVVPESLKTSKETCYANKENVITFKDFFDVSISEKRPHLRVFPV
jgi:hypothetical protein